jgi:hypothetical protein
VAGNGNYTGAHCGKVIPLATTPRLTTLQSLGWEHYEVHEPEPHILLFK